MKLAPILAAVPLALATATPVLAQAAASGQSEANGGTERRVCRARQVTGSNIRARRVCLTESEWRQRDQLDRQRVDDLNNRMNGACRSAADSSSCIGT